MIPLPPRSTLFPYTTLFRSCNVLPCTTGPSIANTLESLKAKRDWAMREQISMPPWAITRRSEEHTSELQSHSDLVCRLLLEKKKEIAGHVHILVLQDAHTLQ